MRRTYIGELEEIILLLVLRMQEEAYGVAITKEMQNQLGRKISVSAVHATLNRLGKKGLLSSYLGGATAERGGRRKRFFKVTSTGKQVLQDIQEVRELLWSQLPPNAFST